MDTLVGDTPPEVSVYQGYTNELFSGLDPYRDYWFEYPPGLLMLSSVPRLISDNPAHYFAIWAIMIVACLVLSYLLIKKKALWFIAPCLAAGILLTHRFDFFPAFLVLLALKAYKPQNGFITALLITIAGFMKIYPFLLLPLVYLLSTKPSWKWNTMGILLPAIPFLWLWLPGIQRFIEFHGHKPVQIESIQGMAYAETTPIVYERFSWVFAGTQSSMYIALGILLVAYVIIFSQKRHFTLATSGFFVVLAFILGGGIFSPQYMLWLSSFLPFIPSAIAIQVIGATWLTSFYFQFYDFLVSHVRIGDLPEYTLIVARNIWLIEIYLALFPTLLVLSGKKEQT